MKGKLGAVVTGHILAGEGEPQQRMEQVRRAVQSLRREEGAAKKKLPAGPAICESARLIDAEARTPGNQAVLDLVLSHGMCFMLRCGEFLSRDAQGFDQAKVIRGVDLELREGPERGGGHRNSGTSPST